MSLVHSLYLFTFSSPPSLWNQHLKCRRKPQEMEFRGSLICATLLIWYRNGLAKSLAFAGNTWFCFFKYPFKSISCGLSSTTKKPANATASGESCYWAHTEKNLPFIFVSISYVIYYQLLPGIFAASPGAIAGVTLNEFTQMRLFMMHSNFRLCLPGFCIWMQKSDKHSSLFSL